MEIRRYGFDCLFFRRFWALHKIIFPGVCNINSALFATLLTVALGEQFLVYQVGLVTGKFYKVLGQKNWDEFKTVTANSILIILAMAAVKSIREFVSRSMTVGWRRTLNLTMHKLYFADIRYYQLNALNHDFLDNPDQRLTTDINILCTQYGSVITTIILAPFLISYYSYSAFTRSGWVGTGTIAFFFVSTVINKFLMSPIVNLTVEQDRREGDFRFKHMTVRVNSESLAFLGSPRVEALKVDEKLLALCNVQQNVYRRQLYLELATNSFNYIGSIASFLVISVPIFSGIYDDMDASQLAQVISENAFVCMYLIYQFSKLVDMSSTVTCIAGATHRVMELAETLTNLPESSKDENDDKDCTNGEDFLFSFDDVTVAAPGCPKPLISHLSVNFRLGKNLLIMGPSSSGKSSCLRILRGLWPPREGHRRRRLYADDTDVLFLPQKPFFTQGSLREQIAYPLPCCSDKSNDEWIVNTLEELGLGDLVRRCTNLDLDPLWNWYDVLSPGEMQRLAFVRLFFHRPQMAFLDEATSSVAYDVEQLLYEKCISLNMTLVSVGHRESLKKYHSQLLKTGLPDGGWTLEQLD